MRQCYGKSFQLCVYNTYMTVLIILSNIVATRDCHGFVFVLFQYFIPLVLMIYCYVHMMIALQVRVGPQESHMTEAQKRRGDKFKVARKNVMKTLGKFMLMLFNYCLLSSFRSIDRKQ